MKLHIKEGKGKKRAVWGSFSPHKTARDSHEWWSISVALSRELYYLQRFHFFGLIQVSFGKDFFFSSLDVFLHLRE